MHQVGNHFYSPLGGRVGGGDQISFCVPPGGLSLPLLGPPGAALGGTGGRNGGPPAPQNLAPVAVGLGKPAPPPAPAAPNTGATQSGNCSRINTNHCKLIFGVPPKVALPLGAL